MPDSNLHPRQSNKLYLASKSPRRRELLAQIGVPFELLSVNVPEEKAPGESADTYVSRLSQQKAQAGVALLKQSDACILGADTIVVQGEQVLEKPQNVQQGVAMLMQLSERQHQVYTAIAVAQGDRCLTRLCKTSVYFRSISEQEAHAYWLTGEPCDKAGGYGIQGFGSVFVERIEGSYSNVVGLPLFELHELLREFDVPIWQQEAVSS